jgi:hypothetical protein
MRKQMFLLMSLAFVLFIFSCSGPKGSTGPAGPSGANVLSMSFQDGMFPFASYVGILDTYADSLNASTNNYGTNTFLTGYKTVNMTSDREFISVDMSPLVPSNAVIVKAYLSIYQQGATGSMPVIQAYRVTRGWMVTFLDWNSTGIAPWNTPGGDFDPVAVSDTAVYKTGDNVLTLTLDNGMVQSWMTDPGTNYGVILIAQNENVSNGDEFFATSAGVDFERPKLTVYYTLP